MNILGGNTMYGVDISYDKCKSFCNNFAYPGKGNCGFISYNHKTGQCSGFAESSSHPHRGIIETFNNENTYQI